MSTNVFLGLDIGTSGCKAVLADLNGVVVADRTHDYPLDMPRPLWSEQNPQDWWRAASAGISELARFATETGREIAAIGLTGQMHGLVLLDSRGEVLRPAILWNDQRTAAECDEITQRVGSARVIELTGNPVLTGFTAPKIAWVRKHESQVFRRVAKALLPKDYVRFRLSGECFSDVADASGTSLFDVRRRTWSDEMLAALGVPRAWLPEVTESPVASTRLSESAASRLGLRPGIPIAAGAGDQAAQAVGCGIIEEGVVSVTLGTSGVVFAASRDYRVEPAGRLHAFCHAVPNMWHLMGVMLSAGGSLAWLADALEQREDELIARAAEAPPGSEGLLFLPYLTGERTPHADPHARGVFFGLTARHRKPHLVRAVLEGVAFGLCDSLDLLRALGLNIARIRASGGGLRSELWRQILADAFATPLVALNAAHGAAYGAALLAAVSAGAFPDVPHASRAWVRETGETPPGADVARYEVARRRYRALYPAVKPLFER